MPVDLTILVTVLVTLLYTLVGLRALLHVDAMLGARYLPKTANGTWLSIAFWILYVPMVCVQSRLKCNRRLS